MTAPNMSPRESPAPNALLPELLVEILADLSLEDVLACQLVSRGWHAAFTGSTVISVLCRRHFPALPRPYALAVFQAECRKVFRRRRGDFTTRTGYTLSVHDGGFAPDEAFHQDGVLPPPVLSEPQAKIATIVGYGEGNVVWTPGADWLCVDNLYTRRRRLLDTRNWPVFVDRTVAQVTSSVLLHHHLLKSVYIHHIATDRGVVVTLCSEALEIRARENQVLVLTQTLLLYIIEYSGLDKPVVRRLVALDGYDTPGIRDADPSLAPPAEEATAFVDPCDPQKYFVATMAEDFINTARPGSRGTTPISHGECLIVREFHGSTLLEMYVCKLWQLRLAGLIRAFGEQLAEIYLIAELQGGLAPLALQPLHGIEADGHGTVHLTGFEIACYDVLAAGLPGPINRGARYRFHITFNTITKEFGEQRYLAEGGSLRPGCLHPPWNQQYWIPRLEPGGGWDISVLDEDHLKSWRSARRQKKYSMPSPVREAASRPPKVPESAHEAPSEGSDTSDTASEGWETLSEDSGLAPEPRSMDNMSMWLDSDFIIFHDNDTENYVVWDFREDAFGSVTSKSGAYRGTSGSLDADPEPAIGIAIR